MGIHRFAWQNTTDNHHQRVRSLLPHPFVELPKARDALRKHVDREDKGVAICDTLGGRQQTTVLIQHPGSNYKTQVVIITAEGRHY